ncbi:recombinase family protein [Candidatus Saccharibacteria bacterium]|nr:recombinase family protein [Candidatus Saccharibacteria bacterium]
MIIHEVKAGIKLPTSPIKRVAAYARVSSNRFEAEDSLEAQISYYKQYVENNASYVLAGIYADNGLSGTNPNRPEFQRMLKDARNGKIDLIVAKSITRFARNIVTLLTALRELKALGINVYFEKENINSISSDGELIISLLAMYAEEEARSASENKRWQVQKQFERGIPTWNRMLGLKWVNGEFKIVPEEAKTVRRIFELYLSGMGRYAIIAALRKEGIKPLISETWNYSNIYNILRNEKYAGDLLLQKTYRNDFRTKKNYRNKGEQKQYYIKDIHEAIIPREMFNAVQAEIVQRQKRAPKQTDFSDRLFTGILRCHCCGCRYGRKHRHYDKTSYYWVCNKFSLYGKESCPAKKIRESILIEKAKQVLNLPAEQKLTKDVIHEKIERIDVMPGNKLCFYLKTGETKTLIWEVPSRSQSWTPKMREKTRQRTLAQRRKHNKQ